MGGARGSWTSASAAARWCWTLTRVTVPHSHVEIDAEVRSGSLLIVTRPGVEVDATDVSIRSGKVKVRSPSGTPPPASLAHPRHRLGHQRQHYGAAAAPQFLGVAAPERWHLADQ